MRRHTFVLMLGIVSTAAQASMTQLTPKEMREVSRRIEAFYSSASKNVMDRRIPKFSVATGRRVKPNPMLAHGGPATRNTLQALAGMKANRHFRRWECRGFLAKHFPRLNCGSSHARAQLERNDRVEDLTDSWMDDVSYDLDVLPTSGQTDRDLWSDDYWRTGWGQTSYRYAERKWFRNYRQAIASYAQPREFNAIVSSQPAGLADKIASWSPAEKYDLTVGDTRFSMTAHEKEAGEYEVGPNGDVEGWIGICHGWSAAAIMAPKAMREVSVVGAKGVAVKWYPHDLRAMTSLAWANADYPSNFIGGRCEAKAPSTFANGRLSQQDCFDTNPATFHLALANLIGVAKASFIMDAAFDYQVWNQPVKAYEFTYFNPLHREKTSKSWREVAVAYNDEFKGKDRFQKPLTRGKRTGNGTWDDKEIKKVVGVRATIVYLVESRPTAGPTPARDEQTRTTYTYDLELSEQDGNLVPSGGEWHTNTHPDFLWVPARYATAIDSADSTDVTFTGKETPSASLSDLASSVSSEGIPMCQVLRTLLAESSGRDGYSCDNRR